MIYHDTFKSKDTRFTYMLLSRLQSDLTNPTPRLWADTAEETAETMVWLWLSVKVKPVWMSFSDLRKCVNKLTGRDNATLEHYLKSEGLA
jgi:hypothetical protein